MRGADAIDNKKKEQGKITLIEVFFFDDFSYDGINGGKEREGKQNDQMRHKGKKSARAFFYRRQRKGGTKLESDPKKKRLILAGKM